jgi:glycerophosphoryl diester phosphodiesterase
LSIFILLVDNRKRYGKAMIWANLAHLLQPGREWFARQVIGPGQEQSATEQTRPARPFLRIAHRGAAALEPENTLRGIEKALSFGVDMVEVDVRPCAGGTLVIIHDDDLKRLTGSSKARVSTSTLAYLKTVDAGKGERIPTLEEVLALLRGRAQVNLDLKKDRIASQLLRAIDRAGNREETMLSGGAVTTFRAFREVAPSVRTARSIGASWHRSHRYFLARYTPAGARSQAARITGAARASSAGYVTLDWRIATAGVVQRLHRAGLAVLTWTVDDLSTMHALKHAGVDGITSNRPDLLAQLG